MEDLMAIFSKQEELCDELKDHMFEQAGFTCVKHPLVFSVPHHDFRNAMLNEQLKQKKEAVAEAYDNRQWNSYIYLHERPYRLEAFTNIYDDPAMSPQDYWKTLMGIYTDSENIWQEIEIWADMFRGAKAFCPTWVMDEEELTIFKQLTSNNTVTLYRGVSGDGQMDGLSWTTDIEKARWFANRFQSREGRFVIEAEIPTSLVLCYTDGRGEKEVVLSEQPDLNRLTHKVHKVIGK